MTRKGLVQDQEEQKVREAQTGKDIIRKKAVEIRNTLRVGEIKHKSIILSQYVCLKKYFNYCQNRQSV